ncbi:KAP family NTPase [Nocardia sp. NBC_01499]|uniref:P-loop NTPase fold protein n=1 Tax=Nocardia sp. NBC_01499 TaxID=2903597 RepID=UPI00386EA991
MSGADSAVLLHPEDLIDDSELESAAGDRLAHERFSAQLAAVVKAVPARSNIALYGAWGSGKSSIANMLRTELTAHRSGIAWCGGGRKVKFARFDAFKYAETPLRRNFISAIATELGNYDSRFHAGMYSATTITTINPSTTQWRRVILVFLGLLAAVAAVAIAAVAVLAWLRHGPFWGNFRSMVGTVAMAGLVPATLVSGLVSLAAKPLQVEQKNDKPDSGEQFEALFKALIDGSGADRVVVFVDELDRCSASTVATTLDTIRTFFQAPKCVFVVAADRRMLEEALTRAEPAQPTPADLVNPYYSTGSAYLDKIFQYQLSLPPLLPQRVTQFALDVVEGHGGVWSEINAAYVVSVLVPTHVRSPRRVKHLLNTFALTYRSGQDRHRQGLLIEDPRDNAGALAKLVCLCVEFPLFARDLEIDARLPEYVLALHAKPSASQPGSVSDAAWALARRYSLEQAPPATLLTSIASEGSESGDSGEAEGDEVVTVAEVHNKQLIDYLTRTRAIKGPSRDLVFLHSSGTAFGLDGELSTAIEEAAENGSVDSIGTRIAALTATEQRAALKLLVAQINTGIGVGVANAAHTLLTLVAKYPSLPLDEVADAAAAAVNHAFATSEGLLDSDTVGPAWSLATQGTESESKALRANILATVRADSSNYDAEFVLTDPMPAIDTDADAVGEIIAAYVVSPTGPDDVRLLANLPDPTLSRVIGVSGVRITRLLGADLSAWSRESTATSAEPAASGHDDYDPRRIVTAMAELARDRAHASASLSEAIVSVLLGCNHQSAFDAVSGVLPAMQPSTDPALVGTLLTAAHGYRVGTRRCWLDTIAPAAITAQHAGELNKNLLQLWSDTISEEPSEAIDAVANVLEPLLAAAGSRQDFDITDQITADLASVATDPADAAQRLLLLERTGPFAALGVLNLALLAREVATSLTEAATRNWVVGPHDLFVRRLRGVGSKLFETLAASSDDSDLARNLVTQLQACSWLAEPQRSTAALGLVAVAGFSRIAAECVPTAGQIADLLSAHRDEAVDASALWVQVRNPSRTELQIVLRHVLDHNLLTEQLATAIGEVRGQWSRNEQFSFLIDHLGAHDRGLPGPHVLTATGLAQLSDDLVAELLIARYRACTTNQQRKWVIEVWAAARITDSQVLRRLIEEIILPLLESDTHRHFNKGQVDIALDALPIVGTPLPSGVKNKLGAALGKATADDERLSKKWHSVAEVLGYKVSRSGGLLRRRTDVEYGGES